MACFVVNIGIVDVICGLGLVLVIGAVVVVIGGGRRVVTGAVNIPIPNPGGLVVTGTNCFCCCTTSCIRP
jgi:hypothetical protein